MSKDKLGRQMITLGETYRLRSDRYHWILEERREGFNRKTQEVVENWHQSYYPTISQVALRIVNSEAEQSNSVGADIRTTTMHASKRKKLEAAGYKVGDAADFLGLSPAESTLEEMSQRIETVSEVLANNINVVLAATEEAKASDEVEEVSA